MEPKIIQPNQPQTPNQPANQPAAPPPVPKKSGRKGMIKWLGVLVTVLVLAGAGYLIWRQTHKNAVPPASKSGGQSQQAADDAAIEGAKHEAVIQITAAGFMPQVLTMPKSTRVAWENKDTRSHIILANSGVTMPPTFHPNREIIAGGGQLVVFDQPGTYTYFDAANPSLSGTIVISN